MIPPGVGLPVFRAGSLPGVSDRPSKTRASGLAMPRSMLAHPLLMRDGCHKRNDAINIKET